MDEGAGRRVLIGAAWMGGARIVVNLVGFASTIILARLLVPEDFGLVAIVIATAAVISSVSELSLAQALVKFDDPVDADYHSAWTLNLIRAFMMAAVLIAVAVPLANAYSEPRLVPVFAVAAIGAAAGAMENPRIVDFRRELDFRPDFYFAVVEKIVSFVVAIALAWVFRSYWALIVGSVASVCARVACTYIKKPFRPRFDVSRWRELMSFSVWLTLAQIVKTINLRAVPLIAGAFLPTSAVGQYNMGDRIASMPIRESVGALQSTLFPAFSRMGHDLERMRAAYIRAQAMTCLFALPAGFGMAAIAEPMVQVVLGAKWMPAVPIIQSIGVASAFQSVQNVLPLAMANGKTDEIFWRNMRALFIQLPLIVFGLHIGRETEIGGLTGLAIALATSAIVNTLINMVLVRKLIGSPMSEQLLLGIRPFLASLGMVGAIVLGADLMLQQGASPFSLFGMIALICLGLFCFSGLLFLLHAVFATPKSAEMELLRLVKETIWRRLSRP